MLRYAILRIVQETPHNGEQRAAIIQSVHQEIDTLKKTTQLRPRVVPALTLYAYNFLTTHNSPTDEEKGVFQENCIRLNALESDMEANPLHATVGTEIEWYIPQSVEKILSELYKSDADSLKIGTADDEDTNSLLREIDLPWSYSAATQAFMIEQLQQLGAFATPPNAADLPATRIGLHFNIRLPDGITQAQLENTDIQNMIIGMDDALIIAFTSSKRLEEKKSKSTHTTDREASISSDEDASAGHRYRLELRALELDMNNFQELMNTAQYLGIGLSQRIQSYLHETFGAEPLSEEDATEIAAQFESFLQLARSLKDNQDIIIHNDFANNQTSEQKQRAIKIVSNAQLVAEMRKLTNEASTSIKTILEKEEE